jgi:hypothetical protein
MPMDMDAFIERHGHYLIFETKEVGTFPPWAQETAIEGLRNLHKESRSHDTHYAHGSVTIMYVWGKQDPKEARIIWPSGRVQVGGGQDARRWVYSWFKKVN